MHVSNIKYPNHEIFYQSSTTVDHMIHNGNNVLNHMIVT